ncbi:MAG: ABC transporter substrate-binding protein [Bacillota bacterium]
MNLKKISLVLITFVLVSILCISTGMAADEEFIDPDIPESWYEAPQLASEIGLDEYEQSPMLDKRVEEGELPPPQERLPEDPPVVEPYKEIGRYGGTAVTWGTELAFNWNSEGWALNPGGRLLRPTPDGQKQTPFLIKDWEYTDDYKTLTIHLREGLKWSDGHPLTAEDFIFWWEHEAQNEDITPVSPEQWEPVALLDVTSSDDYTVSFHMSQPNPTQHHGWHVWSDWGPVPAHYAEKYHPDFIGEEEVQKKAEEEGLISGMNIMGEWYMNLQIIRNMMSRLLF